MKRRSKDVLFCNPNYSNLFSVWDRLFGTYTELTEHEKIIYGLKDYPRIEDVSVKKLILMPFDHQCETSRLEQVVNN